MATKANGPPAGEEAGAMRQLELLLVPLHHRIRYPLPIPAHLAHGAGDTSASPTASPLLTVATTTGSAVGFGDPEASAASPFEVSEEEQLDRVRRAALAVVEAEVPDLLPWQTRVRNGATQAENCHQVLQHVRGNVAAMQQVTTSVQEQSDHLSHNASAMMVRKAKLELVRDALEQNLAHFTHIDDLCREAGNPFLKAGTTRFSTLLQDIANEMEFLSTNTQYKSAKPYAMRLAVAQQMVSATLKDAVRQSFKTMEAETRASPAFAAATKVLTDGTAAAGDESKASSIATTPALPTSVGAVASSSVSSALELRRHDVAGSFADFLAAVNDAFVASGEAFTSLRRMAELRQGGFGYAGAEAFGEEMLTASGGIEADAGMKEVLDAYRDARVGVVVPLLRCWLTVWYYLDVQEARAEADASSSVDSQQQPQQALSGSDRQRLSGVAEAHTLPQLAEHICGLLQRSLAAESAVLGRLWLRDDIASYLLPKLVSSIAEEVYYAFRSRLLCVDDVGELARTVESIQRVSLRHDTGVEDTQVVADLWLRMIQDTQERLVFRTSVYLRQTVARCVPTREVATVYLRCGANACNAASNTTDAAAAAAKMFYIPGVVHALQLLRWLYPTLEFSVFSVFAEEAVHHSLDLVRQLVRLMKQVDSSDALRDTKAYLCQLAHLQHLATELSHVDANITVVERHINFASLRKSRFELEQSSRESKKEVQVDLLKCSEQLTTAMLGYVTQPMSGAAKKSEAERRELVGQMKGRAAGVERMIAFYIEHGETRVDLVHMIRERTAELAAEVDVPLHSVPAATVTAPSPRSIPAAAAPSLPPPGESGGGALHAATAAAPAAEDASTTAMTTPSRLPAAPVAAEVNSATASPAATGAQPESLPPPAYTPTAPPPQTLPPPPPPSAAEALSSSPQRPYTRQPAAHTDDTDLI